MKRYLKVPVVILMLLLCFTLYSCKNNNFANKDDNSGENSTIKDDDSKDDPLKVVPTYEGISISKKENKDASETSLSGAKTNEITNESSYNNDESEELEKKIEDIVNIDIPKDDEIKYYVSIDEKFLINVHLSNPSDYKIDSFTLNGKKYSSFLFEENSTGKLILLELTAPTTSGYTEYEIDNIKYVDTDETKDVKMNGNKTVKVGIKYDVEPSITNIEETIKANSVNLKFTAIDAFNLIGENTFKMYLSDGNNVVDSKDIAMGSNDITFNNLYEDKTYEYGILAVYDIVDGKELQKHWLLTDTFTTLEAFSFNDVKVTSDKITFDVNTNGDLGVIKEINLFNGTNKIQSIKSTDTYEFTYLLPSSDYNIQLVYTYNLNGETIEDTIIVPILTKDLIIPTLDIVNVSVEGDEITFKLKIEDPSEILIVDELELWGDGKLLTSLTSPTENEYKFTETFPYVNEGKIKVLCSYDLKDGKGSQMFEVESSVVFLNPQLEVSSCRILNTGDISVEETIFMLLEIDNPLSLNCTSVVIDGILYPVSNLGSIDKIEVNIPIDYNFNVGTITLKVEGIWANLNGIIYYIKIEDVETSEIFINGQISILDYYFVNSDLKQQDYSYPDEEIYFCLVLDNPTSNEINEIIFSFNDTEKTMSYYRNEDNCYYFHISKNLISLGMNSIFIQSIEYSTGLSEKTLKANLSMHHERLPKDKRTIEITTVEQLKNVSGGYYYKLMNDLDMSGVQWKPVEFNGVFDGNGKTISNMSVVGTYLDKDVELGLFSGGNGAIFDLTVSNALYNVVLNLSDQAARYDEFDLKYGTIVANSHKYLIITNCHTINSSITLENNTGGKIYAGGIAGQIGNIEVNDCHSECIIKITNSDERTYVGGILAKGYCKITKSYNTGSITMLGGTDYAYVGGIVGDASGGKIIGCYNTGIITEDRVSDSGIYSYYLGGIVGYSDYNFTISKCYNLGMVKGKYYIGGIIGYTTQNIDNCYNEGKIEGNSTTGGIAGYTEGIIDKCYNSGEITGDYYIGGIAGKAEGKIRRCYNVGTITGNRYVGGIVGNLSGDYSGDSIAVVENCLSPSSMKHVGTTSNKVIISNCVVYESYKNILTQHLVSKLKWSTNIWNFDSVDVDNNIHPTFN